MESEMTPVWAEASQKPPPSRRDSWEERAGIPQSALQHMCQTIKAPQTAQLLTPQLVRCELRMQGPSLHQQAKSATAVT